MPRPETGRSELATPTTPYEAFYSHPLWSRMQHNPYVCTRLGKRKPWNVDCQVRIIEHHPDLQSILIRTYRCRYPLRWLWLGSRIKQRLVFGDEVIVELTPVDKETQKLLLNFA